MCCRKSAPTQTPGHYKVPGGISVRQCNCTYATLDKLLKTSDTDIFLPSYIALRNEVIARNCSDLLAPQCGDWSVVNGTLREYFIPDLRFFLIAVTHGFTSTVGISRSASGLSGKVLDQRSNAVDLCAPYTSVSLPCPQDVGLSSNTTDGVRDLIPLGALLNAAGISYLDALGGGAEGGIAGRPKRLTGIVLLVTIDYTNYFLNKSTSLGTGVINEHAYVIMSLARKG